LQKLDELVERDELPGMTRRDRKKQETRWRIYSAGIELFSDRGYDNVIIEQICEQADVSSALFFHHFSSKSALIHLLLDKLKIRIGKALAEASTATSAEKLRLISAEIERSTAATAALSTASGLATPIWILITMSSPVRPKAWAKVIEFCRRAASRARTAALV